MAKAISGSVSTVKSTLFKTPDDVRKQVDAAYKAALTKIPTKPATNDPYSGQPAWKRDINKYYDTSIKNYETAETEKANQQKAANQAAADAKTRQAYINNILQQRAMQQRLARNGIVGGAAQTSMINMGNNLATNTNAIANNLGSTNTSIDNNLRSNIQAQLAQYEEQRRTALANEQSRQDTLAQNKIANALNEKKFQEDKKQSEYNRKRQNKLDEENMWAQTSVYSSVSQGHKAINSTRKKIKSIDKEMKSLRKKMKKAKGTSKKKMQSSYNSLKARRKSYVNRLSYQKAGLANYVNSRKK